MKRIYLDVPVHVAGEAKVCIHVLYVCVKHTHGSFNVLLIDR